MSESDYTEPCFYCDGAGFTTNDDGDLKRCQKCNPEPVAPKSPHYTPRRRHNAPELHSGQVRRVKVTWFGTHIERTEEMSSRGSAIGKLLLSLKEKP
jgi:hypothetical protein